MCLLDGGCKPLLLGPGRTSLLLGAERGCGEHGCPERFGLSLDTADAARGLCPRGDPSKTYEAGDITLYRNAKKKEKTTEE